MPDVHVILSDYGAEFGIGVTSPQVPGLVGSIDPDGDANAQVVLLLSECGLAPDYHLELHVERYFVTEGREWSLRVSEVGLGRQRRYQLASRWMRYVEENPATLDRLQADSVGSRLCILTLATDTLGWMIDQLDADGGLTAVITGGETYGLALPIRRVSAGEHGIDRATTFAQIVAELEPATAASEFAPRELLTV